MGRTYPTLIFNFSSIKPVEEKIEKLCSDLKMTSFKSPTKVKGVNIGSDPVAAMAALYQQIIDSGVSPTTMNQMKNNVRAIGFDPDAMNVVEEDSDENKKKRAKGNDAEGTFSNDSAAEEALCLDSDSINFEFPKPEFTYSHKLNRPAVHYEVALDISSNIVHAVDKTTNSSTSVVTHTSSLTAVAASNVQIIKMIPNLTT